MLALLCPFFFLLPCTTFAQTPELRWQTDAQPPYVELSGLNVSTLKRLQQANWQTAHWQKVLAVYVESTLAAEALPPMQGTYRIINATVRFTPQYPLEPGVSYRAAFYPASLPGATNKAAPPVLARYQMTTRTLATTTTIANVYPSANELPENLLKFYVHFSAPMRRGGIYEFIHLRSANGQLVELPFLEIDEELWDPSLTRLTLIIDPGRIKRGVLPLEQIGPALETGKSFTLEIKPDWKDAQGNPLKTGFQKTFKVIAPDRTAIDTARWEIEAPAAGTRAALTINFNESLEHALATRLLTVVNANGQAVSGKVELTDHERRWNFVPEGEWPRGRYQVVVQTTLEDLAGNNIGKPFEVDLVEGVQRSLTSSFVKLDFEIR